ncbi:unnamed protein product [Cercospora beticola]|nr:unnamed protein product [Cercospora beticola]
MTRRQLYNDETRRVTAKLFKGIQGGQETTRPSSKPANRGEICRNAVVAPRVAKHLRTPLWPSTWPSKDVSRTCGIETDSVPDAVQMGHLPWNNTRFHVKYARRRRSLTS